MAKSTSYEKFVALGKHFHGFKYSYPDDQIYDTCYTQLKVYCKKHEEYFITNYVRHITQKSGCKRCGNERGTDKRRHDYEKFVIKGKEIHGESFTYPAKQFYINSSSKLKLSCNTCKAQLEITYNDHITGKVGCRLCAYKRNSATRRHGYDKFLTLAKSIHGEKFYYLPSQLYINAHTPLKVFCREHQDYFQTNYMRHITAKRGCFLCANRQRSRNRRYGYPKFLKEAKEIHGEKYIYQADLFYKSVNTKFPVFCKRHERIFQTSYALHIYEKCGCPDCGRNISKGERVIKEYFIINNIEFVEQYRPPGLKHTRQLSIDFYLPTVDLLIEYQGEQHFKPSGIHGGIASLLPQLRRDQIKRKFAYDNNIELMTLEKYQLKDLASIFKKFFPEKSFKV